MSISQINTASPIVLTTGEPPVPNPGKATPSAPATPAADAYEPASANPLLLEWSKARDARVGARQTSVSKDEGRLLIQWDDGPPASRKV